MSARIFVDGNLVADPRCGVSPTGTFWADLRIASHERVRKEGEWVSTDPQFFNVTLFGSAAERAADSLTKGDPVHVEGRVELEEFTRQDGDRGAAIKIYARSIGMRSITGHDTAAPDRAAERSAEQRDGGERHADHGPGATVHHTPDGTVVTGIERSDRELHAMLKGSGFHWSAKTSRWFLPVTEDEPSRTAHVEQLVTTATGAGRHLGVIHEPPPPAPTPARNRERTRTTSIAEAVSPSPTHTL